MPKSLAFEIRTSPISGKGAFAVRPIKKGERLIEYTGERIPHPVADSRYDDESMDEHHTFLFSVSSRTVIDATHGGNEARYINHSCDPNCESEIERGKVWIFAIKNIPVGEELHYDYGYERSGDETEADERRYKCRCGTKKCRGSIMESKSDFLKRKREEERKKAKSKSGSKTKSKSGSKTKKKSGSKTRGQSGTGTKRKVKS